MLISLLRRILIVLPILIGGINGALKNVNNYMDYLTLVQKRFKKKLLGIEKVLLMGDRKVVQTKRNPIKKRRTKLWYDVLAYSVN